MQTFEKCLKSICESISPISCNKAINAIHQDTLQLKWSRELQLTEKCISAVLHLNENKNLQRAEDAPAHVNKRWISISTVRENRKNDTTHSIKFQLEGRLSWCF